jgi:(1->4)-alpha-D-glucan 1-alpha-D-glucosylmutase
MSNRQKPIPPRATYRVQLSGAFGFDAAAELAPYLAELGLSHLYASPYLQAARGSTHGYDVVDHRKVNAELGGEAGHKRLTAALKASGLGQLLDVVPNHMAIGGRENAWWCDVLENGPSSRYASYFDVDWNSPEAKLENTILAPVLGDHYGRVLEAGEIKLTREGARFYFRYFDHAFPAAPRSLSDLLGLAAERCGSDTLAFYADALARLPLSTATDRKSVLLRHRDKEVIFAALERFFGEFPACAAAVDAAVDEVNRDTEALDILLERQNYRLAH